MKFVSSKLIYIWVFIFPLIAGAQDRDSSVLKVDLNGYIKNMESIFFTPFSEEPSVDILFHNRLNFDAELNDKYTLHVGMRNRLLIGDSPQQPGYLDAIRIAQSDWWDMSWSWWEDSGVIGLTEIDRLYFDYSANNWQFRIGRQRINWGINLFWNPNDIFNAYSFTDFDYEERPGVDAVLIRKYWGFASGVEVAIAPARDWDDWIMGTRLQSNWKGYDMQFIAGKFRQDLVGGLGWAGNIGQVGFKGEMSYFINPDSTEAQAFTGTLSSDYMFGNGIFLTGGFLYNSEGQTNAPISQLFTQDISAKNLYPYSTAVFVQSSYQFTPLLTASGAVIYSLNDAHPLFLNPSVTYSMATNWDLDLIGQIALFKLPQEPYQSLVNAFFLRVKFSF